MRYEPIDGANPVFAQRVMEDFSKMISRFYLRQRNVPSYVAVRDRIDGAGAQVHGIMSTIVFARTFGLVYVHRPFSQIDHGGGEPSYASEWENFMGLGWGEVRESDLDMSSLTVRHVNKIRMIRRRRNVLYTVYHCHKLGDWRPELYETFGPVFRDKYYASEKPTLGQSDDRLRVAVHIRRGDVTEAPRTADRYTSNEEVGRVLNSVTRSLAAWGIDHSVEVHSQGRYDDFASLPVPAENIHLDDNPRHTFHALVTADVLIMSKSSFSYAAAVLSGGAIVYLPFHHTALPSWVPVDDRLTVDGERLRQAVQVKRD